MNPALFLLVQNVLHQKHRKPVVVHPCASTPKDDELVEHLIDKQNTRLEKKKQQLIKQIHDENQCSMETIESLTQAITKQVQSFDS